MTEDRIIAENGDNTIGQNIHWIRKCRKIRQTEMVARLQTYRVAITREALVKIEGGRQHIKLSQLRAIRDLLEVSYEDLLDGPGEELQPRIEELKRKKRERRRKAAEKRGE